tara:strand:+ start:2803 stop:2979 length:177 start_codon:yes stop_codon:yes gene_type:complete
MNTKRIREYQQEIERLREVDRITTIKINQQFADMKNKENKEEKQNFDKRLLNFITNLK